MVARRGQPAFHLLERSEQTMCDALVSEIARVDGCLENGSGVAQRELIEVTCGCRLGAQEQGCVERKIILY